MRKCVICGNEVATGAKKYCLKCKEEQYVKVRRKSQLNFFNRIEKLEPVRKCLKCGEVKRHNAKCNVCPDCYSPKYNLTKSSNMESKKKKAAKKNPEDALFESLLSRRIKEMSIYGEKIPKIRERKCHTN